MDKIKFLTELMEDGTLNSEIKMGIIALNSGAYEQAWNHLHKAYMTKGTTEEEKGKACYFMYCIMERSNDDDDFILNLKNIEPDLAKIMAKKEVGKEYPRRYVGRKYLEKSAQYGYGLGLIDYSLICVGYGEFSYKDEIKNVYAGLDWADVMKNNEDSRVRAISYVIYAKYHYLKRIAEYAAEQKRLSLRNEKVDPSKETVLVKEFGKAVLNAAEEDPDNQYVRYYLAVLYANVLFSGYDNKRYYDPKKGYNIICELEEEIKDGRLSLELHDFKNVIEKHYPKFKI